LDDDLRVPPGLSVAKRNEVLQMLAFSQNPINWVNANMTGIDYDHLVTSATLETCFGYRILEDKNMLKKLGRVRP
jgi:hypothetical protein